MSSSLSWFVNWRMHNLAPTLAPTLAPSLSWFVNWRMPILAPTLAPNLAPSSSTRLKHIRRLRFKMHLKKVLNTPSSANPDIVVFFQKILARKQKRQERNKRWSRICRRTRRMACIGNNATSPVTEVHTVYILNAISNSAMVCRQKMQCRIQNRWIFGRLRYMLFTFRMPLQIRSWSVGRRFNVRIFNVRYRIAGSWGDWTTPNNCSISYSMQSTHIHTSSYMPKFLRWRTQPKKRHTWPCWVSEVCLSSLIPICDGHVLQWIAVTQSYMRRLGCHFKAFVSGQRGLCRDSSCSLYDPMCVMWKNMMARSDQKIPYNLYQQVFHSSMLQVWNGTLQPSIAVVLMFSQFMKKDQQIKSAGLWESGQLACVASFRMHAVQRLVYDDWTKPGWVESQNMQFEWSFDWITSKWQWVLVSNDDHWCRRTKWYQSLLTILPRWKLFCLRRTNPSGIVNGVDYSVWCSRWWQTNRCDVGQGCMYGGIPAGFYWYWVFFECGSSHFSDFVLFILLLHGAISSWRTLCFFIACVAGTDLDGVAFPTWCNAVLVHTGLRPCRRLHRPPIRLQRDPVHEEVTPCLQTEYPFLITWWYNWMMSCKGRGSS